MTQPFPIEGGDSSESPPPPHTELFHAIADGRATESDRARLADLLRSDDSALADFVRTMDLHAALYRAADSQRKAHGEHETPERAASAGRTNPRAIAPYAYAAAALLAVSAAAVAIYAFAFSLGPGPSTLDPAPAPIATLIDADTGTTVVVDDSIAYPGLEIAARTVSIESGYADFLLSNRVGIKLVGKSSLTMHSNMAATLSRGTAHFDCPLPASGYTVHLPGGSRVVDLGTRFTIRVLDDGKTLVNLIEGRAQVFAAAPNATPVDLASPFESAAIVDGVAIRTRSFDLARLVASVGGINPATGEAAPGEIRNRHKALIQGNGRYSPVDASAQIDGVFIPDGSTHPVVVDSAGHTFADFGATDGKSYGHVTAGATTMAWMGRGFNEIDGVDHSTPPHTVLSMLTNKGITFDLHAIAAAEGARPIHFTARFARTNTEGADSRTDAFVFVDGEPRMVSRRFVAGDRPIQVDVTLTPNDRYLTLVATDGGDSYQHDWIVIGDPRIVLAQPLVQPAQAD